MLEARIQRLAAGIGDQTSSRGAMRRRLEVAIEKLRTAHLCLDRTGRNLDLGELEDASWRGWLKLKRSPLWPWGRTGS